MSSRRTVNYYVNKLSTANNEKLRMKLERRDQEQEVNFQIAMFLINRAVKQKEKAA